MWGGLPAARFRSHNGGVRDWSPAGPILIVEDDADLREVLAYRLRQEGYQTVIAPEGAAAMCKLRAGLRPCMILLDLMMPVMDGFAFRQAQRSDPEFNGIPVAIYSAHYDSRIHAAALDAIPTTSGDALADLEGIAATIAEHCLKT